MIFKMKMRIVNGINTSSRYLSGCNYSINRDSKEQWQVRLYQQNNIVDNIFNMSSKFQDICSATVLGGSRFKNNDNEICYNHNI